MKNEIKIIPSIASANMLRIGDEIDRLGNIGCLHLDIEDGNFCPSMTFGMDTVRAIAAYTRFELDAHLMVTNPLDYVENLIDCGVKIMCAHMEALPYPAKFLGKVQSMGGKAGLALNMKTGVEGLEPFISQLDYILLLTNEPDFAGLKFRDYCYSKIDKARRLLPAHTSIWVDGGVTMDLLPRLIRSGADTVIMGRAIFNAENPYAEYKRMIAAVETDGKP